MFLSHINATNQNLDLLVHEIQNKLHAFYTIILKKL